MTLHPDAPLFRDEDRRALLRWAREAIAGAVGGAPAPRVRDEDLTDYVRAPHGAFVTLTEQGELRGCMGRLDFERSLWENVLLAAVSSALDDPRFPPVEEAELDALYIEISVLEPPVALPDPRDFDPLAHGIIIEKNRRRGLLLPKVAQEYGWDARTTLEAVCHKAGLPPDAWRDPTARLSVFTAFAFGEQDGDEARSERHGREVAPGH